MDGRTLRAVTGFCFLALILVVYLALKQGVSGFGSKINDNEKEITENEQVIAGLEDDIHGLKKKVKKCCKKKRRKPKPKPKPYPYNVVEPCCQ